MRDLSRDQLSQFLPDHESIKAFEQMFAAVKAAPAAIESAQSTGDTAALQADAATALAQLALDMLSGLAALLEQLSAAPASCAAPESDDFKPAVAIGTLGSQNADEAAITGGTVNGTAIGGAAPAAATFTDLTATVKFGCNGKPAQAAVALGAAATDLASVIALANNIRTALIANGIGT